MDHLWDGTDLMGVAQQILAAGGASGLVGATKWNPSDKSANTTLSNNDLTFTRNAAGAGGVRALVGLSSGKNYWEVTINNSAGLIDIGAIGGGQSLTGSAGGLGFAWRSTTGALIINGTPDITSGSYTTGDVLIFAFDRGNNLIYVGKNGSWYGSMNPSAGTGGRSVSTSGATYPNAEVTGNGGSVTANFGATPFNYSVPTGFTPGVA